MTLIIISKESQGYSTKIVDRTATNNQEQVKHNPKVLENYLKKLTSNQKGVTV